MSGKLNIDAVLREWPSPRGEDYDWNQRAEAIVNAAMQRSSSSATPDDRTQAEALAAPPTLAREPGEPGGRSSLSGESPMSDDPSGESSNPKPASTAPRKKQSLKEIAERASQSGRSASAPPASASWSASATPVPMTPLPPARVSTPTPSARPSGPLSTPLPSGSPSAPPPVRPIEAGQEDSGVVDLNILRASVTEEQKAAAENAQPAAHGLMDDDGAQSEAPKSALRKPKRIAAAPGKRSSGAAAGIAIAVLGLAAAFAVVILAGKKPAPLASAIVEEAARPVPVATEEAVATKPSAAPEAPVTPEAPAAPEPAAEPQALAMNEPAKPAAASTAPSEAPKEEASPKAASTSGAPATTAAPGSLSEEMARAAGSEKGLPGEEKAEPASGPGGKSKSSTIPEQPPQGSVQAAVGSVMGGAKACVAGADDVSRAQITFSSSGTVSNVSVSGWASGKSAAGCIKAALQGANVGPFAKSSFTVPVTIRP